MFMPWKPYLSAPQTISFRLGTYLSSMYRCMRAGVTLLRCYSSRKGYSNTQNLLYIYIYYNIYKYKHHF